MGHRDRIACAAIFLAGSFAPVAYPAESRTETELRRQLAVSEAARVEAQKALARQVTAGTQATQAASREASADAIAAQSDSAYTAGIIGQAAITAQLQAESMQRTTLITSIGVILAQLLVLVGIIAGFVHSSMMSARAHKWAVEKAEESLRAVKEQQEIMQKLETNTNSIKDALVKTTKDEAYARGKLEGSEAAKA